MVYSYYSVVNEPTSKMLKVKPIYRKLLGATCKLRAG